MHSGFTTLRSMMPHNARGRDRRVPMTPELKSDIERIEAIWIEGRQRFGREGNWLVGEFGIGDIMYAPVASRFRTYGVRLEPEAAAYAS